MMNLRSFSLTDYPVLQKRYPKMTKDAIAELVHDWNMPDYKGQKFDMFAIVVDEQLVGSVSLFYHSDEIVHEGIEIYSPFRRKGYAYQAVSLALQKAVLQGYKIAVALVRKDNEASISLHRKLQFFMDLEYISAQHKNTEMYYFLKILQ